MVILVGFSPNTNLTMYVSLFSFRFTLYQQLLFLGLILLYLKVIRSNFCLHLFFSGKLCGQ